MSRRQPHTVRLIDRIRRHGLVGIGESSEQARQVYAQLLSYFHEAHVLVADNVIEYYYAMTAKDRWYVDEDFPNIRPPMSVMFIETVHPSGVLMTSGMLPWKGSTPKSWGALIVVSYPETEAERADRVHITCFPVVNFHGERIVGPIALVSYKCRLDGTPFDNQQVSGALFMRIPGSSEQDEQDFYTSMMELTKPFLLAISFMHCKNVPTIEHAPPEAFNKTWRKRQDGRASDLVTYRTLDIAPFAASARRAAHEQNEGDPSSRRAMHLMRGHFKTFTEDHPLMGKHVGTYWWNQQVRGDSRRGRVEKDYRIDLGRV